MRGLLLLGVRVLDGVTLVCNTNSLHYQESEYRDRAAFDELVVVGEQCMLNSLPVESAETLIVTGEFESEMTFPNLHLIGELLLTELSGKGFHFPGAEVDRDVVLNEVMASDISLGSVELAGVYISHCDIGSVDFGQLLRIRQRLVVQASTFHSFEARELLRLGGLQIHQKLFDVGRAFPKLSAVEGDAILHIDGGEEVDFGVRIVDGMLRVVTRWAGVLRFSNLARVGGPTTLLSRSRELQLVALPSLAETDYIRMLSSAKVLLMDPKCRWEGLSLFDANNFCETYQQAFKKKRFVVNGGCQHPICYGDLVLRDSNINKFKQCVVFWGTLLVGSSLKGSLQGVPLREVKGSVTLKNRSAFAFSHLAIVSESLLITGKSSTELWDLGPLRFAKQLTIHQSHGIKEIKTLPTLEIVDLAIRDSSLTTLAYHGEKLMTLALSGNQNISTLLLPNISQISNLIIADNPSLAPIDSLFPNLKQVDGGMFLSGINDECLNLTGFNPMRLEIQGLNHLKELTMPMGIKTTSLVGYKITDIADSTFYIRPSFSGMQRSNFCRDMVVFDGDVPYPCKIVTGNVLIRAVEVPTTLFWPTVIYGDLVVEDLRGKIYFPRLTRIHGKLIARSSNMYLFDLPSLVSIGGLELHKSDIIPSYLSNIHISRELTLISTNAVKVPKLVLRRLASLQIVGNPYLQKLDIKFMSGLAGEVTIRNNSNLAEIYLDGVTCLSQNLTISGNALVSFDSSIKYTEGSITIQGNPRLSHLSFPYLTAIRGELEVLGNPNLVSASFPVLKSKFDHRYSAGIIPQ